MHGKHTHTLGIELQHYHSQRSVLTARISLHHRSPRSYILIFVKRFLSHFLDFQEIAMESIFLMGESTTTSLRSFAPLRSTIASSTSMRAPRVSLNMMQDDLIKLMVFLSSSMSMKISNIASCFCPLGGAILCHPRMAYPRRSEPVGARQPIPSPLE